MQISIKSESIKWVKRDAKDGDLKVLAPAQVALASHVSRKSASIRGIRPTGRLLPGTGRVIPSKALFPIYLNPRLFVVFFSLLRFY